MDLEELAFKNVNELTKLSKEELLMIIALLQQDRKCWIQQFTKTHNNSVDIRSRIDKAIELNGKILNMIDDGRSREQFLPYLKEQQEILKGSDK